MALRLVSFALLAAIASAQPVFEVATVKPSPEGSPATSIRSTPGGRIETQNVTLRMLIKWAWNLDDDRLSATPKWLDDDHYDVVGKSSDEKPPRGAYQQMMQSLLRERFHLAFHNETRELTAYALVIDKSSPKVHIVDTAGGFASSPFQMTDRGRIAGTKVTAEMLAKVLAEQVKHPVQDATGFKEAFDFTLEWAPDGETDSIRPSIFSAIKEQLGFRLDAKKTQVEVLVIDKIERTPTAN